MTQTTTTGADTSRYEGTDYVCRTCGSEIMVKHAGDGAKGWGRSDFTCTCGTPLQPEHGTATGG